VASGLVRNHLCRRQRASFHPVRVVDNDPASTPYDGFNHLDRFLVCWRSSHALNAGQQLNKLIISLLFSHQGK